MHVFDAEHWRQNAKPRLAAVTTPPKRPDVPFQLDTWLRGWFERNDDCGVIFLTTDAVVVDANAAVERVLGYRPDELVGHSLRRIFTAEDLARGLDRHELEVAARLGRAEDDRWHVAKGGRRVWISGVMCQVRDDSGALLGLAKVMRDRTDVRSQVESLRRLAEGRARALAAKEEALVTVGHELRNPVGTLSNAIAVLRRCAPGSTEAEHALVIMERQIAVAHRLVDDLRQSSSALHATPRLDVEPIVLQTAVRSATALHAPHCAAKSQRLEVVLPDRPIAIEVDPVRLEQILRNLLDNAVKYTPEGGCIAVTATVEGDQAVLRIEDDGMGMTDDVLPRIFELFTRDHRAVDAHVDGLGVGLALVKQLVSLHGGVVEVQSAGPGQGSEFTVSLPLRQRALQKDIAADALSSQVRPGAGSK